MTELIVKTKYGRVEGFVKDGLSRWYGIPYAKPPINDLRFRRAVECEPWQDIKKCTEFQNRCPQFKFPCAFSEKDQEDCLYLNIWRKNNDEKNLPVFVYIHGGYLHNGGGSIPLFHGDEYANEDILFVNFNYRLGPLGCYNFSIYNKEEFDSNCCLSDQVMALKWINENIEAFGGNPNNITIDGESAGGASVLALMTCPTAKGLFQKAISQSGYPDGVHYPRSNKLLMDMFLEYLNLKPEEVTKIKSLDCKTLRSASQYVNNHLSRYPGIFWPSFVYDDLLPEDCYTTLKNGSAEGVKLIIGMNRNESTYFNVFHECPRNKNEIKKMFENNNILDKYPEFENFYFNNPQESSKLDYFSALNFSTDRLFTMGCTEFAEVQSQNKNNEVWVYRFDYIPPLLKIVGLNATHGIDLYTTFKKMDLIGYLAWTICKPSSKRLLENYMFGSWVQFAKTGNPNGEHLNNIIWEKYDAEHHNTFIVDKELKLIENPSKEKINLWKSIKREFYK
ncbi:alpha/beta-hydrolase [Anaeromyces robustus]|uniref:Carboxylic ester hydrolase n=1 Tax=Anaeromyces robustus TaxID=1754192 RepID=A0A1Y1WZ62_9FUNG|nr:alpha/beta-hydrolase [Anaeromyces robustus]|eukprot:ORX78685.1 alpha/beta-hydrolase [Anaeromyces robustus]